MLISAMLFSSLFGCTSKKPEVNIIVKVPTLTMNTVANDEITDAYSFMRLAADEFEKSYTDAHVTVDVYQFELTDETEAVEGYFNTEYAADILYEGYFNMSTYIHSGHVVPLDDIITDEMRSDIADSYWQNSMLDSKTYMLPFLSLENVLIYNKKLFRQCGLDKFISDSGEVQSWTVEEWDTVLTALAENLPENSYPMMMYAANDQGDTHTMTLLRMFGCEFFDEDEYFNINNETGIKALQWIKDGYDKGYFPPQAPSIDINDNTNLFLNDQLGIALTNSAIDTLIEDMDVGYVNFPSADGKGLNTSFITGFEVFDNGDEDKLAAAKAFVKFIYESDLLDYSAGGIPCSSKVAEKYADQLTGIQKYIDAADCGVNFTGNNPNWRGVRQVFYPCIQDLLHGSKSPEETAKLIDEACNTAIKEGYKKSSLHK